MQEQFSSIFFGLLQYKRKNEISAKVLHGSGAIINLKKKEKKDYFLMVNHSRRGLFFKIIAEFKKS